MPHVVLRQKLKGKFTNDAKTRRDRRHVSLSALDSAPSISKSRRPLCFTNLIAITCTPMVASQYGIAMAIYLFLFAS